MSFERLTVEQAPDRTRRLWVAYACAGALHLAAIALLFMPRTHPPVPSPERSIFVEFVELAPLPPPEPEPVAEPEAVPDIADVAESPEEVPEPVRATAIVEPGLPELDLPGAPATDAAGREGVIAALREQLCINLEGEDLGAGEPCPDDAAHIREWAASEEGAAEAELLSMRRAADLGLGLAPNQVAPVADVITDPYAPDDYSWENPVEEIRGEIF